MLLCCASPETDLEIETGIALTADDIPAQSIAARVAKLELRAADLMLLHLRTPRSQSLRFLAGQHARLEIAGVAPRHKSLASCPCNATHLEFHVRRARDDVFAEHVFNRLRVGDTVQVSGPAGQFVFREHAGRPAILLAFETGFAAIRSLIEHSLAVDYAHALHLVWVVAADGGHYADNYCRSVADGHGNFTYTALRSGPSTPC
ncbi:MAG: FAD-binding oxidoreductase [Chromatiales bacterium]|nr:FAD-binding oxidoreductase [Chromatiales bacterium]